MVGRVAKYAYDFSEGNRELVDLLGGKGANLAEMTNLGLPVPPGFTITTEACRAYLATGAPPFVEVGASVHFDMQTWSDLQPGDRIVVQRAPYTIRFVHPEGYSFFSTLRRKLHWNLMPEASDNVE